MTTADIFDYIYRNRLWGTADRPFCSGAGTVTRDVSVPYVDAIRRLIQERRVGSILDLGCGDFWVGRPISASVEKYTGVDVAPSLVKWLKENFEVPGKVDFIEADIATDQLPSADLVLVRQVLQHLSNKDIEMFLQHSPARGLMAVTEHQPLELGAVAPNIDKPTGNGIRLDFGSGVYLDHAPFDLPQPLETLLEVPADAVDPRSCGVIRTFIFDLEQVNLSLKQ